MRKVLSLEEIVNLHIQSNKVIEMALMNGDSKTNNKEVKKLNKLTAPLKNNLELSKSVYGELFKADCIRSHCHAAVDCLRFGIHVDEAKQILEELLKRDDIGITRTGCEMALKVWRGEIPGKTL
jgi:hypothetical protein